jgi:hypothetical protein
MKVMDTKTATNIVTQKRSCELTSDHAGETEAGIAVPAGTTVEYRGHLPGGIISVQLPDGTIAIMHPHCFPELR